MKTIIFSLLIFTSQFFAQTTWNYLSATSDYRVNVIRINSEAHVYAGTKSQGIIKSTDGGLNWKFKNNGLPENEILSILITKDNLLFAGTSEAGLYRSFNGGDDWQKLEAGLTNTVITSLVENEDGIIYAGTKGGGVFYSTDKGSNWSEINSGLINKNIIDLDLNSNGDLYAGTHSHGVFKLTKGNNFWDEINIGMPNNRDILAILVNKNNDVLAATAEDGIYIRDANSLAWTQTGLQQFPFWDLHLTASGKVLAATNGSAYISHNGGRIYELIQNGLPDTQILSLASDNNEIIYAGTLGNGIYKHNSITSVEEEIIPQDFHLFQNYPNPFNPTTVISYKIPDVGAQHAAFLQIYDLIGNEIKTLINKKLPSGTYNIIFNADGLPSGIYFYKLTYGNFSQTRKMLLIK